MLRSVGAAIVGLLTVGVVVFGLQAVGSGFHPLPEGLDPMSPDDAEAFAAHLAAMPAISWAIAFASELVGAFLGAIAAGWIAQDRGRLVAGIIVGIALLGSVNDWTSFDHPLWFIIGQLVAYPIVLMGAWVVLGTWGPIASGASEAG